MQINKKFKLNNIQITKWRTWQMFKVHITITCEREKKSENNKKITHLEFLKTNELFVSDEDGTKPCFMFLNYNGANFFIEELKNVFNLDATRYNYLGFHTVYVPISRYQDALIQGFHILLTDEKYEQAGAYWMDYYGNRTDSWGYEPILMMELKPNDLEERGHWKPYVKNKIERWNKKFENVLDQEVCFREDT